MKNGITKKRCYKEEIAFDPSLPEGFQCQNLGTCFYAVELICKNNLKHGFDNFRVVTGYLLYVDIDGNNGRLEHRWIKYDNGEIFDPTLLQACKIEPAIVAKSLIYDSSYYDIHTPQEAAAEDVENNITNEFKKYHYTPTQKGEFFKGAMWKSEVTGWYGY